MTNEALDSVVSEDINKGGRPTIYSEELAQVICESLMVGMSLRKICELDGMPAISTVMQWLASGKDGFMEQYAHARQVQAEYLLDELIDIADDSADDYEIVNGEERLNQEHIQRAKLRIDTRKWNIEKLAPKRYGSKQQIESNVNLSVSNLTDDELDAQIAALNNGNS
ncbi:hypothetical protein [Psychrobacter sp. UBA2514]|jgi:hypothetical protein|uniref:terminase small subunit-like protein n=1 Tax=Psychrobacter sp. UBA2514 TaxID=1947346 RepID=UPI002580D9C7|nr:hypothetical protein [Psychrobacter sp. UBA2514]|tara:strand:- start:2588 stop:3091 length:504 start_codon:yes stop_codon:yes gene_type:complete